MKLSEGFFYQFDHEEIQKELFVTGKYQVAYDFEFGEVFGIYVNTGLDCPQIWEKVNIYNDELHTACINHLSERMN